VKIVSSKKLFFLLFTIAFLIPIFITLFYPYSNGFLKALFLTVYPKMNIVYYGFLILFLFLNFIKKYSYFAVIGGILFIVFFYIYIGITSYLLPLFKAKDFVRKHPDTIFTTVDKLKNMGEYKLLYKNSVFVVIKKTTYNHTNPFNYKKQRNQ
jgi:4-amino-4-deoxy-L-arabinose transferase-like glycosyltransferase